MNLSIIKLRFWAIVAVIMIHSSATFLYKPVGEGFMIGNLFDSMSRYAVPLFLMISGALLLSKDEPIGTFFKKRTSKIILPFIIWSIVYYLYNYHQDLNEASVKGFILEFIDGEVYYHLWYLYLIVCIYLFIPLLRKLVVYAPTNLLIYYVVISLGMDYINHLVSVFTDVSARIYFVGFQGYLAYVLMGYLIVDRKILAKHTKLTYMIGIAALLVTYIGTHIATDIKGSYDGLLYRYISVNVFLYTTAIMVFILNRKQKVSMLVASIAKVSFRIYFVHILFLTEIEKGIENIGVQPMTQIAIVFSLTLILSYLFSIVIEKIPVIRRII